MRLPRPIERRPFYRAVISFGFLVSIGAPLAFGGAISQLNQPLGTRDPLRQVEQIAAERMTSSGGSMAPLEEHSATIASFMVGKYATVPFELTSSGSMQRMSHTLSQPNSALVYQNRKSGGSGWNCCDAGDQRPRSNVRLV